MRSVVVEYDSRGPADVRCFAAACDPLHGDVYGEIAEEGLHVSRWPTLVGGDTQRGMAHTAQLCMSALPNLYEDDHVYIVGDRYECLAVAYAAHLLGIPIIHQQGGEVSGCIDDRTRDAISALASVHLVAHEQAAERLRPWVKGDIHIVGCPRIDELKRAKEERPTVMVIYHPVTDRDEDLVEQCITVAKGQHDKTGAPVHVWWPNADAGHQHIVNRLKRAVTEYGWTTHRNMSPQQFYGYLKGARAIIGNSSVLTREAYYVDAERYLIGERQEGRVSGRVFGEGDSGKRIADILEAL